MLATYQQSFRLFSRDVRLFLFAGAFVGFTYFGIYALLLNLYLLRLGYGPAVIGLVNAAGPLALALGSLPAGVLSQRWGSRRSLILGFSLLMLGFGLLPLVEFIPDGGRIGWLVATYMLAWLGGTFFVVSGNPFLVSATTAQERNHAFALQSAILALSGFVGNLVGGLLPGWFAGIFDVGLEQALPYRYPLWFAAALMLPAVFAAWALQPVSDEPDQRSAASSAAAPVTMMLLLTLVFLLRGAGEWAMRIFFNVYLDAGLHETTARIGTLTAVGQLLGIAALSAPLAMARWGKVRTIGWGSVGMACAYLPLILLRHWVGGRSWVYGYGRSGFAHQPNVHCLYSGERTGPLAQHDGRHHVYGDGGSRCANRIGGRLSDRRIGLSDALPDQRQLAAGRSIAFLFLLRSQPPGSHRLVCGNGNKGRSRRGNMTQFYGLLAHRGRISIRALRWRSGFSSARKRCM